MPLKLSKYCKYDDEVPNWSADDDCLFGVVVCLPREVAGVPPPCRLRPAHLLRIIVGAAPLLLIDNGDPRLLNPAATDNPRSTSRKENGRKDLIPLDRVRFTAAALILSNQNSGESYNRVY